MYDVMPQWAISFHEDGILKKWIRINGNKSVHPNVKLDGDEIIVNALSESDAVKKASKIWRDKHGI